MLYLLLGITGLRLLYWYIWFVRLPLFKNKKGVTQSNIGISMVVAVKNNLTGIQNLVTRVIKQNYHNWELILVDDGPNPELEAFVNSLQEARIRYIRNNGHGKQEAVITGVKAASNEWIALTDSDCMPASLKYFDAMQECITRPEEEIVLGFAPLRAGKSAASLMASYEAAYIGMQYLSFAIAGMPYMGVGRNMLFKKQLYLNHIDNIRKYNLLSGDDDLFIQAAANNKNTTVCLHPYSFCISDAPETLSTWIRQKRRQVATAAVYKTQHKLLLAGFGALHIAVYIFMLMAWLWGALSISEVLASWLLMIGMISIVQYPAFRRLQAQTQLFLTPVADVFLAGFYMVLAIMIIFKKNYTWK